MNGSTRAPLSPPAARRTHVRWTNSPPTPIGERRPCGALLQPVAAVWSCLQRVAGSLRRCLSGGTGGASVTPAIHGCTAYRRRCLRDTGRWAVRLGRHPLEKVSRGPKGRLRRVRNPPQRARPKAGLTGSLNARDPEAKAGPSDPSCPHCWGPVVTEKLPQG